MKWLAALVITGVLSLIAMSFFIGAGAPPEMEDGCFVGGDGVLVNAANLPDQVSEFSGEQLENAALIINAGEKLGVPKQGQTIAVMTSIGESTLINVAHGDAVGPDSRGLFQQRAEGWGSLEERMDPTSAATSFYEALLSVDGWEDLAPTMAAHRTQRNADPFHYEEFWGPASELVDKLADAEITQVAASEEAGADEVDAAEVNVDEIDTEATIKKYSLGPVRDVTASAVAVLAPQFGIEVIGGHRESDPFPDHPSGLAADFMMPSGATENGDQMVAYLTENAEAFGVEYLLWQQRSWYPDRGWKPMDDRGSITANHGDHVHVTFDGDKSSGALPAASGCAANEADSAVTGSSGSRVTPAEGPITSPFGPRNANVAGSSRNHEGTDFGAPCEAPIVSTSAGQVVYAGPMSGYGHLIEVDHEDGTRSRYAHMYAAGVLVSVGDEVKGGQEIAKVGSDGVSGGCHLHFEIIVDDQPIDAVPWLDEGEKT